MISNPDSDSGNQTHPWFTHVGILIKCYCLFLVVMENHRLVSSKRDMKLQKLRHEIVKKVNSQVCFSSFISQSLLLITDVSTEPVLRFHLLIKRTTRQVMNVPAIRYCDLDLGPTMLQCKFDHDIVILIFV